MPRFELSLFQLFLSMRQPVIGIRKISVSKIIDVFFVLLIPDISGQNTFFLLTFMWLSAQCLNIYFRLKLVLLPKSRLKVCCLPHNQQDANPLAPNQRVKRLLAITNVCQNRQGRFEEHRTHLQTTSLEIIFCTDRLTSNTKILNQVVFLKYLFTY